MKLALLFGAAAAYQTSFGTDRILRLNGELSLSASQVSKAQELISELDVWGHTDDGSLELRASAEHAGLFASLGLNVTDATDEHVKHFTWFKEHYDEQVCTKSDQECASDPAFYTKYQTLDAIQTYIKNLATQFPTNVKTRSWGQSGAGLDQLGVAITGKSGGGKPIVFYFCGEHAREWLPPMFCVYMAEELATLYKSGDKDVVHYLDTYDFHILPVMNPDGYKYSMASDNMWRKSRKTNTGSSCVGTDLNRNYGFKWGTGGSSTDPCSETYMGKAAWDNAETRNMQSYAQGNHIVIQTDVHAYGKMWMHPWGWSKTLAADDAKMTGAGKATVAAIYAVNQQQFAEGSIANVIYVASGSSCDYFYGQTQVIYAYAPEVRGTSFQPPASNIVPSNKELWAGMMAQVKYVIGK